MDSQNLCNVYYLDSRLWGLKILYRQGVSRANSFSKDIDPNHRQAEFGDIIQTNGMIKNVFSPNLV